jgi:lipopolysaccharide transport system permease protein
MVAYVGSIWRCRYFWLSLVRMDLRSRYHGSVLGLGWSLLHPVAMTIILCIVFCTQFGESLQEYAPYVMAGLTFWHFVTTLTMQGCHCFLGGEAYIRQYPAPLAIYPLRVTLACGFHFLLAMSLVLILATVVRGYTSVWPLLTLLPATGLILCLGWSIATIVGLANVMFRDTHHIAEIILQIVFYATPIMYRPKFLGDSAVSTILSYNPFLPFLQLLRMPILESQAPSAETYATACLIALGAMLLASLLLRWQERKLIFYL